MGPWIVAFGAMILVAWPLSAYPSLSTRFLPYYITCMLCMVVIVCTVETWQHLTRLMSFSCVALVVMSFAALYQRAQGIQVNPSFVDMNLNKGMPGRVWSFYENPNTFAEVLLLLIPVAVATCCAARAGLAAFGPVQHRGLCGHGHDLFPPAGWAWPSRRWSLCFCGTGSSSPAGILVALVGLALLPDTVFNRILTIFNTSDTSTNSRFPSITLRRSSSSSGPSWAPAWGPTPCGRPSET